VSTQYCIACNKTSVMVCLSLSRFVKLQKLLSWDDLKICLQWQVQREVCRLAGHTPFWLRNHTPILTYHCTESKRRCWEPGYITMNITLRWWGFGTQICSHLGTLKHKKRAQVICLTSSMQTQFQSLRLYQLKPHKGKEKQWDPVWGGSLQRRKTQNGLSFFFHHQ